MNRITLIGSDLTQLYNLRLDLIKALIHLGIQVHVIAPLREDNQDILNEFTALNVSFHNLPLHNTHVNPFADLKILIKLFFLLRFIKPHVTFSYTLKPVVYGSLAAWFARVPARFSMVTGLGEVFLAQGWKSSILRFMVRTLYGLAFSVCKKVFVQNNDDIIYLTHLNILSTSKAVHVPGSGVNLTHFPFTPVSDKPFPHFLFVGRLMKSKGIDEFVKAAYQLHTYYPQAQFTIVGGPYPAPSSLSPLEINSLKSLPFLNVVGKIKDVRPYYKACTVLVLPSYREGVPRSVLEAMAIGRAIVTTDTPGCRDTVKEEENGFLVPIKDVEKLTAALERFCLSPQIAVEMGRKSRQLATEKFCVHQVNTLMLATMGFINTKQS